MKKILIILMVLASIFLLSDKVYAEEEPSIHDLSVIIELNDDKDSINVKETFKLKNIAPDTYLKKVFDNGKSVYDLDSNYFPKYHNSLDSDGDTLIYFDGEENEKDCVLEYDFKSKTVKKGEKYTFKYFPPTFEYREPLYENVHIVIKSTKKNPVTLDKLTITGAEGILKAEADGNIITITGNGKFKENFSISFDKVSYSTSISEITGVITNIMTMVLVAMVTLTVMKVITGNSFISNIILVVAIGGAALFFGTSIYTIMSNPTVGLGVEGFFPLAMCGIIYGVFYGALFYSKKTIEKNKFPENSLLANIVSIVFFTFGKLFVCIHSYFMMSAFTGMELGDFNINSNQLLLRLIIALFIGSFGYQYFDRDNTSKNFKKIKF